jgi:hypothetical protein
MIDPSVCINKELSNINGTVARANLKLKLEWRPWELRKTLYAHRNRESRDSGRLPPDGILRDQTIFMIVAAAAGIGWTFVCVRTQGCSAARDAKLVERPHERDRHHGFPRGDGFGWRRLGSGCSHLGIPSYLNRRRSPVVDQFDSGDSSID